MTSTPVVRDAPPDLGAGLEHEPAGDLRPVGDLAAVRDGTAFEPLRQVPEQGAVRLQDLPRLVHIYEEARRRDGERLFACIYHLRQRLCDLGLRRRHPADGDVAHHAGVPLEVGKRRAAKGDVTLRSLTDVVGAVVAGDEVIAESAANVSYVGNNYLASIPEPSALVLVLVIVVVALFWARNFAL